MATLISMRRLVLAGGFAVAVAAAPAFAVFAVPVPSGPAVACPAGEEEDLYTGVCVPHTVPNSSDAFSSPAGNPDLPSVNLPDGGGSIPCTGANSGQCIGLAEEEQSEGPQPVPESTVGSSPTVTGHIG
ncbi:MULTISPECIES: intersectin-EH binding protein Ibp1 [unclassified Mycolicibacterium]|uniref:intersectin-EH binding protein Ibp1 n=1 Tax=unclassified Mycolicibacterium TaxID=2636767 RepID=UPI0012DF8E01|nr:MULTISPECIES: intersectin-EH binding protein Ibp1 [unclassified Mycolicibacterium]MUL83913.1 intersectin-EH binding protein Ibp1 [Mycolicibacterium sp. CBMA 329]MUL90021.1 intersectin-EH binding protein Ibp1 [Mycolicibacterium sp. CBMA 331]MUL97959.1 intersectin-EH binding protein Ibp1 [Mycolicibacterium sp. CBMA 334]MUM27891.1 intersectin-EH binding protein Ibp1 [Mycolicibacterium sp. CBMA 295]MUM39536.1 intersectin-EH binding protein Ibp1 [Mycolicibacterium sp. CBMA 247]